MLWQPTKKQAEIVGSSFTSNIANLIALVVERIKQTFYPVNFDHVFHRKKKNAVIPAKSTHTSNQLPRFQKKNNATQRQGVASCFFSTAKNVRAAVTIVACFTFCAGVGFERGAYVVRRAIDQPSAKLSTKTLVICCT